MIKGIKPIAFEKENQLSTFLKKKNEGATENTFFCSFV